MIRSLDLATTNGRQILGTDAIWAWSCDYGVAAIDMTSLRLDRADNAQCNPVARGETDELPLTGIAAATLGGYEVNFVFSRPPQ